MKYHGRHFLVIKNADGQSFHLGDAQNFRELASKNHPNKDIPIALREVSRTGVRSVVRAVSEPTEQQYTVNVPHTEERHGTRRVYASSKRSYVEVPFTYNVTVNKPETRTRTVNVVRKVVDEVPYEYTVTVPVLKLADGLVLELVESSLPTADGNQAPEMPSTHSASRFGVSGHSCAFGFHIDHVVPGSAAANLVGGNGSICPLDAGDHIVSLNGKCVYSAEDLEEAIQNAPQSVCVQVLDGATGRMLCFRAELPSPLNIESEKSTDAPDK